MQPIVQLSCSGSFLNKFKDNLHLPAYTSFKALWIMEDEVASKVCNLVPNVMYPSLNIVSYQWMETFTPWLTSIDGVKYVDGAEIDDVTDGVEFPEGANAVFLFQRCFMFPKNFFLSLGSGSGSNLSSSSFWSKMMGLVPWATPQTFSRMVVFPALALPMTRIRKQGHSHCSLRILTDS